MPLPIITELPTFADERATYVITGAYYDESGITVIPTAAVWTLTDIAGNVINSKSAQPISPLGTSFTVLLTGGDLAIGNSINNVARLFTVQTTYNSTLGTGLVGRGQVKFWIKAFPSVAAS